MLFETAVESSVTIVFTLCSFTFFIPRLRPSPGSQGSHIGTTPPHPITTFLPPPPAAGPAPAAKYGGGEIRAELGGRVALVAVAAEGAGSGAASAAQQAVLQAILGSGAVVKYGAGRGLVGAAAAQAGGAAAAVNVTYSDAGLVGYTVLAEAEKAGQVRRHRHFNCHSKFKL